MVEHEHELEVHPKSIYNWRVYATALTASFGGALFGYDNAFLGGTLALPAFRREFHLEGVPQSQINNLSSNIVITFQAGCLLACFLATPTAEIWGRRKAIMIACVVFLVGAGLQLIGNLPSFYVGRFLTGLGVGPMTVCCPLFLAEIAPSKLRGRCIGFFEMMYQFGGLLGFWINYGASLHISGQKAMQWRVPVSIQLPLVGVLLIGIIFLPETPRWLIKKDKLEQAEKTLSWIRKLPTHHEYLQSELQGIHAEVSEELRQLGTANVSRTAYLQNLFRECIRPDMLRRISVGVLTQMIGQLSGINGINYYSPTIFRSLGVVGTSTGLFATGIYGVVKTITAFVAYYFLVDRFGRRSLLLFGSVIMTIALFTVGGYVQIAAPAVGDKAITSGGIAACAFIYIYVIGFVSSYAGVPWILSSECVPLNIRATSATLGAASQWLFNLAITKATPYMITSIGAGTFFFYGSCVVVGAVYVWFYVPETRGIPLEEISTAFGGKPLDKSGFEGGQKGDNELQELESVGR